MATYAALESDVIRWAEARKIIPNSTPQTQLLKAFSEMVDCLELAYDQIKNRKGTLLPNGVFVKEV